MSLELSPTKTGYKVAIVFGMFGSFLNTTLYITTWHDYSNLDDTRNKCQSFSINSLHNYHNCLWYFHQLNYPSRIIIFKTVGLKVTLMISILRRWWTVCFNLHVLSSLLADCNFSKNKTKQNNNLLFWWNSRCISGSYEPMLRSGHGGSRNTLWKRTTGMWGPKDTLFTPFWPLAKLSFQHFFPFSRLYFHSEISNYQKC